MHQIKKVLVGLDLSEHSKPLLKRAIQVASLWDATLDVAHIVPESPYEAATQNVDMVEIVEQWKNQAVDQLDQWVGALSPEELRVEIHIRVGTPYRDILKLAFERGADMVLVGSERKSVVEGILLGKTGEGVVRKSIFPVWVERDPTRERLSEILVPTDLSENAHQVVLEAISWAKKLEAKVLLTHVVEIPYIPPFSLIDPKEYTESMNELGRQEFEQFVEDLPLEGVDYRTKILLGNPAREIVQLARQENVDLIILGTHGHTDLSMRLLGSVTSHVLHRAPHSVLVFRPEGMDLSWLKENFYAKISD